MIKLNFVSVIAVVFALAMAVIMNPSPERHRAMIKASVSERSPLAGMLGVGSLTAFVSSYHSIGVASYTIASERVITVGMFGMVFVL